MRELHNQEVSAIAGGLTKQEADLGFLVPSMGGGILGLGLGVTIGLIKKDIELGIVTAITLGCMGVGLGSLFALVAASIWVLRNGPCHACQANPSNLYG